MRTVKKPVILIAESGSGFGGSAKYLSDFLATVDKGIFEIQVVAYGKGPFLEKIGTLGYSVRYLPILRFPWFEKRLDPYGAQKQTVWRYGLSLLLTFLQVGISLPPLTLWLLAKRVRIVHLNNEIRSHLPLLFAARLSGCRILCHLHGWRCLTRLERSAAGLVHLYIGITQAGSRFYKKAYPQGRYMTVLNGILFQEKEEEKERVSVRKRLGLGEKTVCFGMVGRMVSWKGHEIFLEAFQKVFKKEGNSYALIVGGDTDSNGVYLKSLQERVRQMGLQEKVHFTGWQKEVTPYLAAMDVVVHASVNPEAFGLVILEAMEEGKPVIATDGGGVPELVKDRVTGLLVPPKDSDRLASAMLTLLQNPEWAGELGTAGRDHMLKHFDAYQNSRKIVRIYRALLGEGNLLKPRILTTYPVPQSSLWQKKTFLVAPRKGKGTLLRRWGFQDWSIPFRLFRMRKKFDVLVTGSEREDCLFAFLQRIWPGGRIPHVMTCCLWKYETNPIRFWFKKSLLRITAEAIDLFLVWSREECDSYSRYFGIPREKFVFIPHHVSLKGYDITVREGDYIFAGGDSSRDYDTLLEAVKTLSVPTVIVARQTASWNGKRNGKKLPSHVTTKETDPVEFRQLMAAARMVVLPLSGGLLQSTGQQSYLNAMYLKKPVIVSAVPGVYDHVIPEETAIVVPPENPKRLREAIVRVLQGGSEIERMVERAYERVQNEFSLDHFVERMITFAEKVSQNGREEHL